MEMLNNVCLFLKADLWQWLISGFGKWIINYGWAIVVFTIVLKLVLSPLDILQRTSSAKQSRVMAAMQPEIEKVKAKYGDDQQKVNEETQKLYKKYNTGLGGICGIMLVTMIVSMVVLFSLYASLRSFGSAKLYSSYNELDKTYVAEQAKYIDSEVEGDTLTEEEQTLVLKAVQQKYNSLKKQNSWLWVKNVWKSDTKTSQFVSFKDYAKHYKLQGEDKQLAEERYDAITAHILDGKKDNNGYYGLIVICVLVSFLTQFLSIKLTQPKGQKLSGMNLFMMALIPITMLILATSSNVVFTLYVITNSIMSAIISTILSLILKQKSEGNPDGDVLLKKGNVEVVEYSRNYKK